ncbi:MAG: glycosyltransferase family 4 protein [Thermoguttaceae bacterium]|jgi:hypothetical protein|nr:glycosyltransferase family 4 protein [Thermoguttaceae bacterium]
MIFIHGYPGHVGGANTELWHTVKLWRRAGLGVTLIPTGQPDPGWRRRLDAVGCRTIECPAERLDTVPGLAGSVVVAFCNEHFLAEAHRFRRLGCRTVWVNCMNWLFPAERLHYRRCGLFDRYVFQSRYQHDQIVPQLERFGYRPEQGHIIRGALDLAELPFRPRPHHEGECFTVGRISRAAPEKFSPRTWAIYRRTPYPIRARVLGFSSAVAARTGPAPPWAECLPQGSETAAEFLPTLHAQVFAGATAENWPRTGLEAMAAGVPLVVDRRGGWCEMIRHGQTGFLCDTEDDFAFHTAQLARDEELRRHVACEARRDLEENLAAPGRLAARWTELLVVSC